jgi:hypothetical protein
MQTRKCVNLAILVLSLAATAVAGEGRKILVQHVATVAGHSIASGSYSVTWKAHDPGATVSFLQEGKVVVTAEGKLVDRPKKSNSNEVVYGKSADGSREIQEIRFRGQSQAIVFTE